MSHFWILDSGCTQHMSPYEPDFVSISREHNIPIHGINSANPIQSIGNGTALAHFSDSYSQPKNIELTNVLCVPDLPARLFSIRQAAENGWRTIFYEFPNSDLAGELIHTPSNTHIPIKLVNQFYVIDLHCTGFESLFANANPTTYAFPASPPPPESAESVPVSADFSIDSPAPSSARPFRLLKLGLRLAHLRNNHAGTHRTKLTRDATTGSVPVGANETLDPCSSCIKGKFHKLAMPKAREATPHAHTNFRLIHSDWWGPYHENGPHGERFMQCFIDDASGYTAVFCSATASEGAANLRAFIAHLDLLTDSTCDVRIIQSDSATVYTQGEFAAACADLNFIQRFSAPYSQAQNGRAERFWRTIENSVTCMFAYSNLLPHSLWPYAVRYAVHTHNRTPASKETKTPYELLTNRKPDIAHFRVWGCPAYAFIEKEQHSKFEPKARPSINLGPNFRTKDGYFVYFPDTHAIHTTRNIAFDELWRERAEYYQTLHAVFPSPAQVIGNADSVIPPSQDSPPVDEHPSISSNNLTDSPLFEYSDGDNTNESNSRFTPVTPDTDTYDIVNCRTHNNMSPNGKSRYLTEWAPSYNITQDAIDARTSKTNLNVPFVIETVNPSVYDSSNFDVTWKFSTEPKSAFLKPDGTYLDVFIQMSKDNRAARAARRTTATPSRPAAMLATALPIFALLVGHLFASDPHFSSPNSFPFTLENHHRQQQPVAPAACSATYDSSILASAPAGFNEAYAFATVVLPHGENPLTQNQALNSVDAKHWRFALDAEHQQLCDALTWILVKREDAKNVVSGKWVFKIKRDTNGDIQRYKARWCARGFSQRENIDFKEIFAPVIRYSSIRFLLSLANATDLSAFGLNVSNAFARADVDEDLYVEQPHGYVQLDERGIPYVCKLQKGLYGTKQASRLWNKKMQSFLTTNGWRQLESDTCIYTRHTPQHGWEFIGLYVDDIVHICSNPQIHAEMLQLCNLMFPTTSQGELHWILNMRVTRDRATRTLSLDQTRSVLDYLDSLTSETSNKIVSTPMDPNWTYGSQPATTDEAEISRYRSECGSLMYFTQCTRPDIAFAVHRLCSHLHNPNDNCFSALYRVNSYLQNTPHLGVQFVNPTGALHLEAYSDASLGSENEYQQRSQTGYVCYFGGGPVDWTSNLQSVTAISSGQSEFIAAFQTARNIAYLRELLSECAIQLTSATHIYEDNNACIAMSKNPVNHKRNKHIEIKYHYLRDLVSQNVVSLVYVDTAHQIADLLTKPVTTAVFKQLVHYLVRPCNHSPDVQHPVSKL